MRLIEKNPYRVIGVIANCSDKELEKQKNKIKRFLGVNKPVDSELDFSFLPKIQRTPEMLEQAFSQIERNQDKIIQSLFWFISIHKIDEISIEHLKVQNKNKAFEIWKKQIVASKMEVTSKNYSAFNNVGTLLLQGGRENLAQGLKLKTKLIESPVFSEFVYQVADKNLKIENKLYLEIFIDNIIEIYIYFGDVEIIKLFHLCSEMVQKYVKEKISNKYIDKVETISKEIKQNNDNLFDVDLINWIENLVVDLKKCFELIKLTQGENSLYYIKLSDNIAKELILLSISHFKEMKNIDTSELILGFAQQFAVSDMIKEEIQSHIQELKETIILEKFSEALKQSQNQKNSIKNANDFLMNSLPLVEQLKAILPKNSNNFIQINDIVTHHVLNILVNTINPMIENKVSSQLIRDAIKDAILIIQKLQNLKISSEMRERLNHNIQNLKSLETQMNNVQNNSDNSGCGGIIFGIIVIIIFISIII